MITELNEFELLLNKQDQNKDDLNNARENAYKGERLVSDKGCEFYDFIVMVQKLINVALKEYNIEFMTESRDFRIKDPDILIDNPVITFHVVRRTCELESKPRLREEVVNNNSVGYVYSQKFTTIVQFNIFASVYKNADEVMTKFEKIMLSYAGYFKKNGVSEILFEQQLTDKDFDIFRQNVSVRNIQYKVITERHTNAIQDLVDEIETSNVL